MRLKRWHQIRALIFMHIPMTRCSTHELLNNKVDLHSYPLSKANLQQ